MESENLSLPLIEISGTDKGVNLLTAHGSKGLEFEYVFFAGCNASFWEKKRKPGGGYSLPDTMFFSQPKSKDEEELRRLFYVALTRAEQHLTISYIRFRPDGNELEPSMFIAEILDQHPIPVEKVIVDTKDKTKNPAIVVRPKKDGDIKSYNIPVGAHLAVEPGQAVRPVVAYS